MTAEIATKLMYLQSNGYNLQARCIRTNYQARTSIPATISANLVFFRTILLELKRVVSSRTSSADAFSYGTGVIEYDQPAVDSERDESDV